MYATLLSILVVLFCGSGGVQGTFAYVSERVLCVAEGVERIEAADTADDTVASDVRSSMAACVVECNCDLRMPAPNRGVPRLNDSGQGWSSARSLRGAARMAPCDAAAGYVAGRVTRLFDFDLYRASLRADFYLHSLCRLRI